MNACYRFAGALVIPLLALACGGGGGGGSGGASAGGGGGGSSGPGPLAPAPPFATTLAVVDEAGSPVPGATVTLTGPLPGAGAPVAVFPDGRLPVGPLDDPVLAVVEAPGFAPEPVAIGREDAGREVPVRLLAETGATGARRVVVHLAGDCMIGRRYLAPTAGHTAVVVEGDGGASARAVVSSLAPLFRAADLRVVNLETVVGRFPLSAAYPEKIFLIQSPAEVLAALDELGVSAVTLGNNHAYDWLEDGIVSTHANLDAAGVPHVGAGVDAAEAARTLAVQAAGVRIGLLSYTTVNGDSTNDSYPRDSEPVPPDLPAEDAWQYELRSFGYTGPTVSIPTGTRRVGEAWRLIDPADATLSAAGLDAERIDLWRAARAVYPELQDWVARRGHGGANPFSRTRVAKDIADLRAQGCDYVIVELHGGFQFAEVKSRGAESAGHESIDAGADLFIGHHDIPAAFLEPEGGLLPNAVLFYFALAPAAGGGPTSLSLDDVRFYEWREAGALPDDFYAVDAVRAVGAPVAATLERTAD